MHATNLKLKFCLYCSQVYEYHANCRHTNEMKMWSSQLWLRFKQSQIKPHKCFRGFNRIRTHGLCVSAVVLHQLSYEDPYVGSRPIYWIHRTRERNETYEYYVNCGHTNEMKKWSSQLSLRFKQSQIISLKKLMFSGLQWDSNPWPLHLSAAVLHNLRWSHLHFIVAKCHLHL